MIIYMLLVILFLVVLFLWLGRSKGIVFTIAAGFIMFLTGGLLLYPPGDTIQIDNGMNISTTYTYVNGIIVTSFDSVVHNYFPINANLNTLTAWTLFLGGIGIFMYTYYHRKYDKNRRD